MIIKKIEDYYDKVLEKFPDLSKKDLDKLLKHGFKRFYTLTVCGADIIIKNQKFTMYFGNMFKNKTTFWKYWYIKNKIKIRIKYKLKNPIYDGYYYFGVTEEDYKKYKLNKKGRKSVIFDEITLFRIKEESFLSTSKKYFFKVAISKEMKYVEVLKNFKTSQFSLIAIKDSKGNIKQV